MIEVSHLYKSFGSHVILKNIHFSVQKGEIVALIGPSGAGKSTLLRCLNLLEIPQSGQITINQKTLNCASYSYDEMMQLRKQSAMVFQNYNLFANYNALDNIVKPLVIVQKLRLQEALERAHFYLREVDLEHKAQFYPHELSGGQQQRIAIARALALNPNVMLFDEPTSALDPELIKEVLSTIKNIKNKTMILVTHELKFARALAQKIIFMADGEILEQKSPKDFFDNPSHKRAQLFLEKMNDQLDF